MAGHTDYGISCERSRPCSQSAPAWRISVGPELGLGADCIAGRGGRDRQIHTWQSRRPQVNSARPSKCGGGSTPSLARSWARCRRCARRPVPGGSAATPGRRPEGTRSGGGCRCSRPASRSPAAADQPRGRPLTRSRTSASKSQLMTTSGRCCRSGAFEGLVDHVDADGRSAAGRRVDQGVELGPQRLDQLPVRLARTTCRAARGPRG